MQDPRRRYRYTPYFCEENVWWLADSLCRQGADVGDLAVWVFSNRDASIALLNQRAAAAGSLMAWDYHVVLARVGPGGCQVFDFDSRLPFPSSGLVYLTGTFPRQHRLPARWRTWVRRIPADAFLRRFWSDRSHMRGHLPTSEFPDYPAIQPPDRDAPIGLADYRDIDRQLDDGSVVEPVETLVQACREAAPT